LWSWDTAVGGYCGLRSPGIRQLNGWPGPTDYRGFSLGIGARYLVRDNDRAYGHVFTARLRAMGIRDRPITPASPWQNGIAERLIGTLRRECLYQIVIFGEAHLPRVLSAYAAYYNRARSHMALQKNAPVGRAVQRVGSIVATLVLAGLHHQYVRI
jgi:transposase InsO family protein